MFSCRVIFKMIMLVGFAASLTSECSAALFFDGNITSPGENEEFTTTADVGVIGFVQSNNEATPANNLSILIRIKNISTGHILKSVTTTTSGMNWDYGSYSKTLEAPEGGWPETGDADVEIVHGGNVKATVRVKIVTPPEP